MIGVVIPAHNEEDCLERCLESVLHAAGHPALLGEPVEVVVILDNCTDDSRSIVERFPVTVLETVARNVGIARATGADHLVSRGVRWIACTDADSVVPDTWLVAQLAYGNDVVCGVVEVDDWSMHPPSTRILYEAHYRDCEGHRHIHGANLGMSREAYVMAGGFPAMPCHEDVHLVRRLMETGASIAWSCSVRVKTSARLNCRTVEGFGDYLKSLSA